MISLSLFSIALVSIGTYALWNAGSDLLTGTNTIQSGQVKMSYSESNEIGMNNALPMKDEDGKKLDDYFDFTITSHIKTRASDDTVRKLNYNITIEMIAMYLYGEEVTEGDSYYAAGKLLSDYMYKVYLTTLDDNGNEKEVTGPITIEELNNYIIKSQEETFSNGKKEVVTKYRLRIWIDFNYDVRTLDTISSGVTAGYKFRVNVNTDKVNEREIVPILNIPVGKDKIFKVTHEIDNTLQVDSKFKDEYRYMGKNPNNYVKFNNELWRIIGVIPTEDINGNVENRLKIIRTESIGNMKWNEDKTNDWTNATLNTYLNTTYYNTLSSEAKNMIGTTKYYFGGYSNILSFTSDVMWQYERKGANGSDCTLKYDWYQSGTQCYYYKNNSIMQNDTSKKIALIYASDYGYAVSDVCRIGAGSRLSTYRYSFCTSTNWLYSGSDEWLLPQSSEYSDHAFSVQSNGDVAYNDAINSNEFTVHPTLTLSSNVKISGGSGTSSDPYTLSVE